MLSLVDSFRQIYEWRERYYFQARIFDENTGVGAKPDVYEWPLSTEQNKDIFFFYKFS